MYVGKSLKKNKFLKIFKNRLHVSFQGLGVRFRLPRFEETDYKERWECSTFINYGLDGLELFKRISKERVAYCYTGDIYDVLKYYQVFSVEKMATHEYPIYRFIAAVDKRTDKKTLMMMALREEKDGVSRALEWRLNRYDKTRLK